MLFNERHSRLNNKTWRNVVAVDRNKSNPPCTMGAEESGIFRDEQIIAFP